MRTEKMLCLLFVPCQYLTAQYINESKPLADTIIPIITLTDNEAGDDRPFYPSSLTAARDVFANAVAFSFSPLRFKMRGYDGALFATTINGLPVNNLDNGYTPWSTWAGLTEVLRNREQAWGLAAATVFGEPGGTLAMDMRAGRQRRQTAVTYALANRNYRHRVNVSHATGYNNKGWAWAMAAGLRMAGEGYVPGTFYKAAYYYAAAEKKLGQQQTLHLMLTGSSLRQGLQAASVQEAKEAAGTLYYNPSWGYQEGRKRNASIASSSQPLWILTHEYQPRLATSLITSLGFSSGSRGVTALDWYQAADPRPDYYRYLPGYQPDVVLQQRVKQAWAADATVSQINWAQLYAVNSAGEQGRSAYILEDRVTDTRQLMAATTFTTALRESVKITAGVSYQQQQNIYYKQVNDLLGGLFYVDVNQFAERDFPGNQAAIQNDLDHPDRKLTTGDKFGYHYRIAMQRKAAWLQLTGTLRRLDAFIAMQYYTSSFRRTGLVRNGLFPSDSYGAAADQVFPGYGLKTGLTYKLSGRHYLYLHAGAMCKPPYPGEVYLSPRTRAHTQEQPVAETITTAEAGYKINAPAFQLRATAYITSFRNGMRVSSFYHDGYGSLVNYALSGINRVHYGSELGMEIRPLPEWAFTAVAANGRYYYSSRQQAIVTMDNDATILDKAIVYAQHYRLGSTPQEAYSIGCSYRSPAWFINVTGNHMKQQWLEINPMRRTPQAVDNLDPNSALFHEIIDQVKWPDQYTVNVFAGYNKKLTALRSKNTMLAMYAGINNLVNNRQLISSSYEQLRFDVTDKQVSKFPPKTRYAYGINCFISTALRF